MAPLLPLPLTDDEDLKKTADEEVVDEEKDEAAAGLFMFNGHETISLEGITALYGKEPTRKPIDGGP